jgi:hypothetical protein
MRDTENIETRHERLDRSGWSIGEALFYFDRRTGHG